MMFDNNAFDETDITSTPFRVTVSQDEAYQFGQYAAQDVTASVRLTHLTYTPPTSKAAWEAYYAAHTGPTPVLGKSVVSVTARVRTLLLDGSVGTFVIGCFPLDSSRVIGLDRDSAALEAVPPPTPPSSSLPATQHMQRFNDLFDVVLPVPTDVAANLDVRLDVDGSVELIVDGPGQVTFSGEQYSALIPEWMNHRMFRVGAGDEEMPDDEEEGDDDGDLSDDEMAEMYRLARR